MSTLNTANHSKVKRLDETITVRRITKQINTKRKELVKQRENRNFFHAISQTTGYGTTKKKKKKKKKTNKTKFPHNEHRDVEGGDNVKPSCDKITEKAERVGTSG